MKVGRGGMGGEGMVVGNKEIAGIFVLHLYEILQCTEVITQVKVACWPYAADDGFHHS